MKKLDYYFNEAKKKSGSDYRTAKIIGMTRQGVSAARNRQTISASNAAKLADYLKIEPIQIIASADVDKNPENMKIWSKWVAASLLMVPMMNDNPLSESVTYIFKNAAQCILC